MHKQDPMDADSAWQHIRTARVAPDRALPPECALSAAASQILELYLPLCSTPARYCFAQLGQSLDGRIATTIGHSHYVTGSADQLHLHRLRALADAVVIGAGTAIADDPALTVRRTSGPNPVRVVIDPNGRTPDHLGIFHDGQARTLLVQSASSTRPPPGQAETLALTGQSPGNGSGGSGNGSVNGANFHPTPLLDALAARGLPRVLIEGGGLTVSRFLAANAIDRLHVTVAPMVIGSGRPAFILPPIESLNDALRPAWRRFDLGEDLLFDLDLRARKAPANQTTPHE